MLCFHSTLALYQLQRKAKTDHFLILVFLEKERKHTHRDVIVLVNIGDDKVLFLVKS